MSDAKQCDRCGMFFVRRNSLVKDMNPNIKASSDEFLKNLDVITYNPSNAVTPTMRRKSYDICDDCWKDFFNFMDNQDVEGRGDRCQERLTTR